MESLYALADADPLFHCAGRVGSTHPVFAGTYAVSAVVDSRHANTERPAVVIRFAPKRWYGRSESRDNGRLSIREHWRWTHVTTTSTGYHNVRSPRSASKQWISNHSIWTDAFEAAKGVDAAGVGATDTSGTKAFIDVIASREGISLQSCRAATFHLVGRFMTMGVAAASGGSAARLLLRAARVWISIEPGVADALVGYGIHAVCTNSTSRSARRWQHRWNTHGLRVAQKVWQADAAAGLFVTACSDAALNVLASIYAIAASTLLAFGAGS